MPNANWSYRVLCCFASIFFQGSFQCHCFVYLLWKYFILSASKLGLFTQGKHLSFICLLVMSPNSDIFNSNCVTQNYLYFPTSCIIFVALSPTLLTIIPELVVSLTNKIIDQSKTRCYVNAHKFLLILTGLVQVPWSWLVYTCTPQGLHLPLKTRRRD